MIFIDKSGSCFFFCKKVSPLPRNIKSKETFGKYVADTHYEFCVSLDLVNDILLSIILMKIETSNPTHKTLNRAFRKQLTYDFVVCGKCLCCLPHRFDKRTDSILRFNNLSTCHVIVLTRVFFIKNNTSLKRFLLYERFVAQCCKFSERGTRKEIIFHLGGFQLIWKMEGNRSSSKIRRLIKFWSFFCKTSFEEFP